MAGSPKSTENCPVTFSNNKLRYSNSYFRTNEGYLIMITNYITCDAVEFMFVDSKLPGITTIQNIIKGQVKNPFHPNRLGGYIGIGPYNSKKDSKVYNIWQLMLNRALDPEYYNKYHNGYTTDAYANTIVDPDWLNFNIFADWYYREISFLNPKYEYCIDKDALFQKYGFLTKGKKCYGPGYCVLIPKALNNLLIINPGNKRMSNQGIIDYRLKTIPKIRKEVQRYYEEGALSKDTYEALKDFDLIYSKN